MLNIKPWVNKKNLLEIFFLILTKFFIKKNLCANFDTFSGGEIAHLFLYIVQRVHINFYNIKTV